MPDDLNQRMDAELKAYAAERRRQAGEPFRMPPEVRQALQGEVDRQAASKAERDRVTVGWWRVFWPYVGLGGSAVAAAVAVLLILFPSGGKQPARKELASVADRARSRATPAPAPTQELAAVVRDEPAEAMAPAPTATPEPDKAEPTVATAAAPVAPTAKAVTPLAEPADDGAARQAAALLTRSDATETKKPADGLMRLPTAPETAVAAETRKPAEPPAIAPAVAAAARPPAPVPESAPARGTPPPALGARFAEARPSASNAARPDSERALALAPVRGAASRARSDDLTRRKSLPAAPSTVLAATSLEETAAALPPTAPAGGRSTQNLVARYGLALSQALPQRQRFQQADYAKVYRRNLNSPPLPEVLREFQLEQTSGRIRIVDADGSVYLGQVMDLSELPTLSRDAGLMPSDGFRPDLRPTGAALAPARAAPAGSAAARAPATAGTEFPLTAETAREVVFSATGTNRSLNQRVVFQGRLTTTNATAGEPRGLPAKAVQDFTYQGLQGWLSNSILRGRATVGRTQVEINARPVPGP